MDNLFFFFNDKIRKNITNFVEFKTIYSIIDEIDKKIKYLESKKNISENSPKTIKKKFEDRNELYIQPKNNIN
jgi:hypothetical protein